MASEQLAIHSFAPHRGSGGRPVVILHGVPGTMSYFRPLIEALSVTRQVLFVDMPGYGGSSMPARRYTMGLCAELIEETLLRAGITSADLVGHSIGGYRALAVALSGRVQVGRAMLLGAMAGLDEADRERYRQFVQLLKAPADQVDLRAIWLNLALRPDFVMSHPSETAEVAAQLNAPRQGVLEAECRAMAESEDLRPRLRELRIPIVLRVGERDAGTPPAWSEAILGAVPTARLERVPGCAHMLLIEDPVETIRSTLAALDIEP
jgi:pimeloyl-ACP methyl ester carboxylesterase